MKDTQRFQYFRYQLSNGETRAENGYPKVVGEQRIPVISISGKYSFVGTDGVTYWVHYTADENGYHPIVGKLKDSIEDLGRKRS